MIRLDKVYAAILDIYRRVGTPIIPAMPSYDDISDMLFAQEIKVSPMMVARRVHLLLDEGLLTRWDQGGETRIAITNKGRIVLKHLDEIARRDNDTMHTGDETAE